MMTTPAPQCSEDAVQSPVVALKTSLLVAVRRASSQELEPTITLERDALGHSQIRHLHPQSPEKPEPEETRGIVSFGVAQLEQFQDVFYELVLNFDTSTFTHSFRRVMYEEGDGVSETIYSGTFIRESSGKKALAKKRSSGVIVSPRHRPETTFYVCKVEARTIRGVWEPWDHRLPTENVHEARCLSLGARFPRQRR